MHAAPPVRMVVEAEPRWHAFVAMCAAAAAANASVWLASAGEVSPVALVAIALVSAAMAAALGWHLLRRRASCGLMAWDGALWLWTPRLPATVDAPPAPGELRVMLDLGTWILLSFAVTASKRRIWLPVSRQQAGASWPRWRAAMFARRPPAAVDSP